MILRGVLIMIKLKLNEEFKALIPSLSKDEYEGLEKSILKEGIREPIFIWNGVIVDGHNRYSIAKKHDLEFKTKNLYFEDESEVKIWILTNQLSRRNVTPFIKAELELELENLHRERLKMLKMGAGINGIEAPLPELSKNTREEIAKAAGVSYGYIHTVSRIKNSGRVDEKTLNKLRKGEITASKVLKEVKKEERKEKAVLCFKEAAKCYKPSDDLKIVNADFYSWCNDNLEDDSVDLILTDPPYPKEYLHVWEQLSEVAYRVLKPGRYLVAYSGQLYLNYVMNSLSTYLNYVWTMSLHHTGATQLINPRTIVCEWKPILIYKKHDVGKDKNMDAGKINSASGSALVDFIGNDYREKDFHEWGQGESAVGYLMKTLSYPNDLVLDTFVGGGTTLSVAKDLKRKCIGIEIDKRCIDKIKANINKNSQVVLF